MIYALPDLHLQLRVWKDRRDLDGDSYAILKRLGQALITDPIKEKKFVLLPGDIFDKQTVDGSSLKAFTDFVTALTTAEIYVYFIQGNHDIDRHEPIPQIQGASWISRQQVALDERKVIGCDWCPQEELAEFITQVPACDILLLHCIMDVVEPYPNTCDLQLNDIPNHIKYVVTGHTHQVTKIKRGNGEFICTGTMHPCNLAQSGEKGFWALGAQANTWRFIPIASRPILSFVVTAENQLQELRDQIERTDIKQLLMDLRYDVKFTPEVERLVATYSSVHFFLRSFKLAPQFVPEEIDKLRMSFKDLTLKAALDACIDKNKEKEAYGLLQILFNTNNSKDVINLFLQETP